FLLDFISPPVTPYPLSGAQCCRYAFSTASFSASRRGSPMMIWTLGYAIYRSDGCMGVSVAMASRSERCSRSISRRMDQELYRVDHEKAGQERRVLSRIR